MAGDACSCNELFGNLGLLACREGFGPAKKLIFTSLTDTNGDRNFLDPALMTGSAYWDGLINNTDKNARIYPSPTFKTVTSERSDSAFEDFPDQSQEKLNNGVRSILATLTGKGGASTILEKQLNKGGCIAGGVYIVDCYGNVIGLDEGDGKLYPIPYDNGSWDVRTLFPEEGTSVFKTTLGFNFVALLNDGDLNFIKATDTNTNVLLLNGLLDVEIAISNEAVDGFTSTLGYIYSTVGDTTPVEGLLKADFELFNVDDAAAITILTADEVSEGVYDFTFASQDSAENIRLTIVKDGLERNEATYVTP